MNEINLINFRQVNCTKKLYRVGNPFGFSLYSLNKLKSLGINVYFDLRNPNEITKQENIYRNYFSYFSFSLKEKSNLFYSLKKPSEKDYAIHYFELYLVNKSMIRELLQSLIRQDFNGVLIGCKFGKDRTGIIVYLILTILDIDKEKIYEDYHKSAFYLRSCNSLKKEFPNKPAITFNPTKKIIEEFDQLIMLKYKNKEALLIDLKISRLEQQILRRKLL
jgi:protein-tyrosine phosphatase